MIHKAARRRPEDRPIKLADELPGDIPDIHRNIGHAGHLQFLAYHSPLYGDWTLVVQSSDGRTLALSHHAEFWQAVNAAKAHIQTMESIR